MYMQLGVAGLRALENYNLQDHVCPPPHAETLELTCAEMGSGT